MNVAAPVERRVVVVGAGPAGMATALELAQRGVPSIVLEKRATPTRENLFNVTPPMADRLAKLDPTGDLVRTLVPTEVMRSENAVTGAESARRFDAPLAPDATRARGSMDDLVRAAGPPSAPNADTRRWSKVGIGDLEHALRELARTRHSDLIELRTGVEVASVRTGDDWAEAVLTGAPDGTADAVRGAALIDASGRDLLGGPRRVFPEQSHWIGGRFAPPADGSSAVLRRVAAAADADGRVMVNIKLPTTDRTMVWAQVPEDARGLPDDERAALLAARARELGVAGDLVDPRRTAPVTVQLWTSDEPARGRAFKVGDSARAPYFPTSTGAAAALVHDAPAVADAVSAIVQHGESPAVASARYADAMRAANDALLGVSRSAMLTDLGIDPAAAGTATIVSAPPAGQGSSPDSA